MEKELVYKAETYAIRGAVFEVYREMGSGFLENVYQECLKHEFSRVSIPFQSQPEPALTYKGDVLFYKFRPDFICYDTIIVELKAADQSVPGHEAQVFNYLKAARLRVGLLVNFGHHPKLEIKRIII